MEWGVVLSLTIQLYDGTHIFTSISHRMINTLQENYWRKCCQLLSSAAVKRVRMRLPCWKLNFEALRTNFKSGQSFAHGLVAQG